MDAKELLKKVRLVELHTKGFVNEIFSGEYHSVFKGRGIEFSEVREYQFGDDIRLIDWNVSARLGHPFIKVFEEERELTVMLLIDFSKSSHYGTRTGLKNEIAVEICACLAFSAIKNNDKVGAILFTDRIEKFIPPKKGKSHILRILRELLFFEPKGTKTNLKMGLEYFSKVMKKKSISFLISDFYDSGYEDPLKIVSRKHDLIAIHLIDPTEKELPKVGLVKFTDAETGEDVWVDTSNKDLRKKYSENWLDRKKNLEKTLLKSKVDKIDINIEKSYLNPLVDFFKRRGKRYR
jgi:uncharacterized protein (DUF58 family)